MTEFSLIICVYEKENPEFFAQCLDSIAAQTRTPDELIIVKDGPLTGELDAVLCDVSFPCQVKTIALPENVTLGPARAEGVKAAGCDWVAIMDSDDVCRPDRFEKQMDMIEAEPRLGLIGGQTSEFSEAAGRSPATRATRTMRKTPVGHDDIVKFAKKRNPFNHMTVMLRKDLALEAGNYRYFPFFEDYDLWTRMIKNGAICANHPDVLVDVRAGGGMYGRRRGTLYIKYEWRMLKQLKRLGYINRFEFVRNAAVRLPARLLPAKALATLYRKFLRK